MKQTTGFELLPSPANERRGGGLSALPAAALLSAGVMWLLGAPYWAPLSALFCVGAALLGRFRWTTAAALALVAAFCAVFYRQVGAGLLQYANALLHRLTALDGRIHLSFETSQAPQTAWLFAPLSLLSAVAVLQGVRRGGGVLCAVCWTVFAAGCALGFFAAGGLLLLLAGTAALVLSRERALTLKTAALVLVCALLTAPLALLNPPKSDLSARLERTLHRLRCDTATSTLPEGRLDTLPPRSDSSAPALELTMQTPQKLYLRGFLGERYTGTGWTALENETLADEADRFYRLHEDGFYAQSSIGSAAKSVDIISESTLTVTNLSACSGQQYLPYALVGNDALLPDIIGDNRTAGTREAVTLQYAAGSVPQWYALQSALAAAQDSPSVQTYLTLEQQYRAFAYERYLQLTPEAAATAERLLDGHLEGRTLAQIRSAVLDTLEEYLTYDETVTTQCDGEDFLTHLSAVGGRGYDVHYATAAVLLLRCCGVPSRYVEGYYLPAADAAQSVTLTGQNAHAWAEYYLDGVGWVPFEVTPPYMDNEESTLNAASEKEYEPPQLPPPVQQPQEREQPHRTPRPSWQWLLLLLLLPLAAIVRTVLRRRRLKKRLSALNSAAPRDAVAGRYGYAVYLQRQTGLSLPDEEAEALNREALFSDHPFTEALAARMAQYVDTVRALCRTRSPWQRLCDRLWRCIY